MSRSVSRIAFSSLCYRRVRLAPRDTSMKHAFGRSLSVCLLVLLSVIAASAQETTPIATAPSESHAPATCDQQGLSTVFRCVGHDAVGMFHGDSLRWLAVGGALSGASLFADDEIYRKFDKPMP